MIAEALYTAYAQKPGSQHIASLHACRGLEKLVLRHRPPRVLEIGAGIGTLTDLLLSALPDVHLTTTEDNSFCLEQLKANLKDRLARVRIVQSPEDVAGELFDLVVVDGGLDTVSVLQFVAPHGIVFVEGFRSAQRELLETGSRRFARTNIRAMHRGGSPSGATAWGGAYWVFQFEPTMVERASFALRHLWDGLLVTKRRVFHDAIHERSHG
jgi:protein-L-isoaspartate O-methyltransferase